MNRRAAEAWLRIEADPDQSSLDLAFDPQTSGGLLVSVAAEHAEPFVAACRQAGARSTTIIGEVSRRLDNHDEPALILRG